MTTHETPGVWDEYRFYMVGKLIRQDLTGDEAGYREVAMCLCHNKPLRVIGPTNDSGIWKYRGYCTVTSLCTVSEVSMEALWSVVAEQKQSAEQLVQQVQLSMWK
jgi:hypothetical protein